jgi:sugar phosphate permease
MKIRWWICFLLFLTWLISYIDRSLMPIALPLIGEEFHLSPTVMGAVVSAFFLGYASMQIPGGIIADKIGARKAMTLGVAGWSIFSLLTGMVSSLKTLIWVRIFFGLGEGIHPPSAFKVLSAWFNSSEKARANGFVMSSNTLGPMIAPLIFATLVKAYGWRSAFYLISIPGFLLTIAVYWYLRDQPVDYPGITSRELAEIGTANNSQGREKVSIADLSKRSTLWQLFFIYLTWDVTWWGFQAWLPSYLLKVKGFTLMNTGFVLMLPYAAGFIGVLVCGYISDLSRKRKPVLVAVLLGNSVFMLLTATAANVKIAIVFLTLTGFFLPAIQGPFWTLVMDLLPTRVLGYSSGFINTGGQIAGVISPIIIGALIQRTGHYSAGFLFMAISASLSAFLVFTLKTSDDKTGALSAVGLAK